ncbi:Structural maintenance of chromosomes protein 4 [Labeo rohita]|uniref:Structural maintenance of chromosomes protein 4 n=1 Tax=Labeo rohita TaxID=84645 RepID=A0ABQ8LWX5_LABRO|nr:Structural maintenance of chromosomes protein 4 [Labeo rohita]
MAATPSSPFTFVEMELPPDISTPHSHSCKLSPGHHKWITCNSALHPKGKLLPQLHNVTCPTFYLLLEGKFNMEDNKSQVFTLLTTTKQKEESETDKLTKAMKQMITDELQKVESTLVSEMRFMVDQLQSEVQQDIKAVQDTFQTNHDHTTSELQQCVTQIDKFSTCVKELRNKIEKGFQVKSADDADPLLYLTKCQDFLALLPLTDADILATFRTVLHETAHDWWVVRRSSISTWSEFEAAFLSAFLSEDYEDELAERDTNWKKIEQRLRYEGRMDPKHPNISQRPSTNRPAKKIPVQCWRCSGPHPPGKSPHYVHPQSPQSSGHQFTSSKHPYSSSQTKGQSSNNSVTATRMQKPPSTIQKASISTSSNAPMTIPQKLVVPISIATWTGKAIVDTGASYTLIH